MAQCSEGEWLVRTGSWLGSEYGDRAATEIGKAAVEQSIASVDSPTTSLVYAASLAAPSLIRD